jgi:hypothetical protein
MTLFLLAFIVIPLILCILVIKMSMYFYRHKATPMHIDRW